MATRTRAPRSCSTVPRTCASTSTSARRRGPGAFTARPHLPARGPAAALPPLGRPLWPTAKTGSWRQRHRCSGLSSAPLRVSAPCPDCVSSETPSLPSLRSPRTSSPCCSSRTR
eukprot:Amastigsp_a514539_140.p6 type:complete len:114 gc:universal Amastigsp_a514539_140:628-287(-)